MTLVHSSLKFLVYFVFFCTCTLILVVVLLFIIIVIVTFVCSTVAMLSSIVINTFIARASGSSQSDCCPQIPKLESLEIEGHMMLHQLVCVLQDGNSQCCDAHDHVEGNAH